MAFTHTVTKGVTTPAGQVVASVAYTGSGSIAIDETIAIGTNTQLNVAFVRAQLKTLWIYSDVAITVKTNSTSAPDDTLSIQAGVPYMWETGGYITQPLAADVTKIYITNVAIATISIRVLVDSTP